MLVVVLFQQLKYQPPGTSMSKLSYSTLAIYMSQEIREFHRYCELYLNIYMD